jgi:hypothetical protein
VERAFQGAGGFTLQGVVIPTSTELVPDDAGSSRSTLANKFGGNRVLKPATGLRRGV